MRLTRAELPRSTALAARRWLSPACPGGSQRRHDPSTLPRWAGATICRIWSGARAAPDVPVLDASCAVVATPWWPGRCRSDVWSRGAAGEIACTAGAAYDDLIQRLVPAWKNDGRTGLTRPLAARLAVAVDLAADGADEVWLVPVPSRPESLVRRGFSPPLLLARELVRRSGRSRPRLAVGAVVAPGGVGDQIGLGRLDRQRNLDHTMRAGDRALVGQLRAAWRRANADPPGRRRGHHRRHAGGDGAGTVGRGCPGVGCRARGRHPTGSPSPTLPIAAPYRRGSHGLAWRQGSRT